MNMIKYKIDSTSKYRDQIILNFHSVENCEKEGTDEFNLFFDIIKYFKKEGFKITHNSFYKKHFKCLSKYNRIGYFKDLVLLIGFSGRCLEIQIGNVKNLWECKSNIWQDESDERYKKLSYVELLRLKLYQNKLIKFFECRNINIENDKNLSPEEFIIKGLNENTHIHGKVSCLEDIKKDMEEGESYNRVYNSFDKNKKLINCGEEKYFYNYLTNRLSKGIVWHNINNMWWVISGKRLFNVSSFELFDFDKKLSKRKKPGKNKIECLLDKYEKERNYVKCEKIYRFHKEMFLNIKEE